MGTLRASCCFACKLSHLGLALTLQKGSALLVLLLSLAGATAAWMSSLSADDAIELSLKLSLCAATPAVGFTYATSADCCGPVNLLYCTAPSASASNLAADQSCFS
jgi:hypothetical protein